MKYIFKTVLLLLLINVSAAAQPAGTVPDFSFLKLNKTSFTNKNLEPGKMLFFVFFDSECDHCQHAMQYINQHHGEFKKAAVYLITLDNQERINSFMGKYGNNLIGKKNVTILQDSQAEFIRKFKPRKYPSIFLYSPKKELIMYDDDEQNLARFTQRINSQGK